MVTLGALGTTPLSAHFLTTGPSDRSGVTEERVDPTRIPTRTAVVGLDGPLNSLLANSRAGSQLTGNATE